MLGLQNEREWVVFCERVLGEPALATDDRASRRTPARIGIATRCARSSCDAFASTDRGARSWRVSTRRRSPTRAMNTMDDVWAHPQLAARGRWRDVATPAGSVAALLPPGRHDGFDYADGRVPALGAHTDAILAELGVDAASVASLRSAKAV